MTTRADLVMPKLGLTMTEGRIARWAVAPGTALAAGDVVVVVETDKIAFDVEAPGAGALADILVPEGETVAVGTPIAQWLPSDGAAPAATPNAPAPVAAAPPSSAPSVEPPKAPLRTNGGRIVATPYARRIAREAALDLATVTAANARRITAADVHAALTQHHETPATSAPRSRSLHTAGCAIYGAEICVDRLQRLTAEIAAGIPDLQPSVSHFVALAAARVLAASDATIALAHNGRAPLRLPPDATRRLSALVAADRSGMATADDPVTLTIVDADGGTLVGRALDIDGATLGVGAVTQVFRPDAAGQPVLCAEVSLLLSIGDAPALPDGPGLLAGIRALIENPLVLLAT
jgi:pyruvate dehydrogenase E2 component (dihydrolipoamide acetyltransferase)